MFTFPQGSSSALRLLLVSLVIAVAAILATASPAAAHEALVSSSPQEDQQFEQAPTQVELVFTAELLQIGDEGAYVEVVDSEGTNWVQGRVNVAGTVVTAALESSMPDAGYQVRWQVVSGDGHPISGLIMFTVGDAEPFETTPNPGVATATPISDVDGQADDTSAEPLGAVGRIVLVGVAGAAIALVAFITITRARRRRS